MPAETASRVEKVYYGLLVAQRQFAAARANSEGKIQLDLAILISIGR
jgi:hypothetical protein